MDFHRTVYHLSVPLSDGKRLACGGDQVCDLTLRVVEAHGGRASVSLTSADLRFAATKLDDLAKALRTLADFIDPGTPL